MQLPAFGTPLSALDNNAQQMGHVWTGEKPGQGPKVVRPWVQPLPIYIVFTSWQTALHYIWEDKLLAPLLLFNISFCSI
jgi:hypothetical protein